MAEAFPLSKPIRVGGEEVSELTLQDPVVGMLPGTSLKVSGDGGVTVHADTVIRVFSRMANVPPSSVNQIHGSDYHRMMEAYMRFFGPSQETGET